MVNEKGRESLPLWPSFGVAPGADAAKATESSTKFSHFCTRVLLLRAQRSLTMKEASSYVEFLSHLFASLEDEQIGKVCGMNLHLRFLFSIVVY